MKTGLAIWHYPHRDLCENIRFFAANGFASVSLLGSHFVKALREESTATAVARAIQETGVVTTVHHILPRTHDAAAVQTFEEEMELVGAWQRKYGLIEVLSFDVSQPIRPAIRPYVETVLGKVPGCKVAVEDYGLTLEEQADIAALHAEPRFGFLIDIGHMFIRLTGHPLNGEHTLFAPSPLEGTGERWEEKFTAALQSKPFPIFEMHVHSNDGSDDLHWFLEDGPLDVQAVVAAMKNIGFDGIATIESAPGFRFACAGQEADDKILRTRDYWRVCLSKMGAKEA